MKPTVSVSRNGEAFGGDMRRVTDRVENNLSSIITLSGCRLKSVLLPALV